MLDLSDRVLYLLLQCVAVCCSVMQFVAVCCGVCSVLQCVAELYLLLVNQYYVISISVANICAASNSRAYWGAGSE